MASDWQPTIYGDFAADFCLDRLSNLCDRECGVQTGPFGSQLHKKDYVAIGTPIITVEHLGENRILSKNLPCVSDADRKRLSKYQMHKVDIVFSRVDVTCFDYTIFFSGQQVASASTSFMVRFALSSFSASSSRGLSLPSFRHTPIAVLE